MQAITEQQLENAAVDAQSLEDIVNGAPDRANPGQPNGTVTTRLGRTISTLSRVISVIFTNPPQVWLDAIQRSGLSLNNKGDPGGDASNVGTFEQAKAMNFAAGISRIHTTGRLSIGDGGGAPYDRWTADLPESGRNIWWFQAADGSRWRIARLPMHFAQMFGAMGLANFDARDTFNAALQAPSVTLIHWGGVVHYFTPTIDVPSGKWLIGDGKDVQTVMVIPLAAGSVQTGPRFAIRLQNTVGGGVRGFTLDCQRSGEGRGDTNRTHGVMVAASGAGAYSRNVTVEDVRSQNVWGYGLYTVALPGAFVRGVIHRDIESVNCQVNIETTGDVIGYSRDSLADGDPRDGGSRLANEALYHEYGAINNFVRHNPRARGLTNAASLVVTVDGVNVRSLRYINPDFKVKLTSDQAVYCQGDNGNIIEDFEIIGGVIETDKGGCLFRRGNYKIRNTEIIAKNGNGIAVGDDATLLELYAPDIESYRDPAGTTAAFGVVLDGAPKVRWYGSGRLEAYGPNGLSIPYAGNIEFYGSPRIVPSSGGGGSDSIRFNKIVHIPRANWNQEGSSTSENFYVQVDLPGGVLDQAKAHVTCSLVQTVYPGGSIVAPEFSYEVFWIDNTRVRCYFNASQNLDNFKATVQVMEAA